MPRQRKQGTSNEAAGECYKNKHKSNPSMVWLLIDGFQANLDKLSSLKVKNSRLRLSIKIAAFCDKQKILMGLFKCTQNVRHSCLA